MNDSMPWTWLVLVLSGQPMPSPPALRGRMHRSPHYDFDPVASAWDAEHAKAPAPSINPNQPTTGA
jgi:hypothetical protein